MLTSSFIAGFDRRRFSGLGMRTEARDVELTDGGDEDGIVLDINTPGMITKTKS